MATIGHTLVGLSISGLCPAKSRTRNLPLIWLGFMVLAAHSVDLAEWLITLRSRTRDSQHYVTHSPFWTTVIVVILCGIFALVTRVRSPWPYLCIAAGVFSHLILDYLPVRQLLIELYGGNIGTEGVGLRQSIVAEVWLYGLLLVITLLWQSTHRPGCSRPARRLALALGIAATIAAATRIAWIWVPVYALSTAHALLLHRRSIKPKLLWSLVPVIPIAILLAFELQTMLYFRQALRLQKGGNYAAAARLHRQALKIPSRSSKVSTYVYLSFCDVELGNFETAERDLQAAVRIAEEPTWAKLSLAEFYIAGKVRGTSFYRPWEAEQIAEAIVNGPYTPVQKNWAANILKRSQNARILR